MKDILQRLIDGNQRFVERVNDPESFKTCEMKVGTTAQEPVATVLGCSDSRVPIVTIFDQGVGDLFISRVVGNVATDSVISTIEYGVDHLHTKLVVILGHTNCGAMNCVVSDEEIPPYLSASLSQVIELKEEILSKNPDFCQEELEQILTEENVKFSIKKILERSEIARSLVDSGKIKLVGAIYQLETGKVKWL